MLTKTFFKQCFKSNLISECCRFWNRVFKRFLFFIFLFSTPVLSSRTTGRSWRPWLDTGQTCLLLKLFCFLLILEFLFFLLCSILLSQCDIKNCRAKKGQNIYNIPNFKSHNAYNKVNFKSKKSTTKPFSSKYLHQPKFLIS